MPRKVAIVGRPNVGKSTLFNRIIGRRKAITDETAGVTRDLNYEDFTWNGRAFTLVDTGGFTDPREGEIEARIVDRIKEALTEADLVVLLTDAQTGLLGPDEEIADIIRRSRKPAIVAVNKVDDPGRADLLASFYGLGLATVLPVSGMHGTGTGDLLDAIIRDLPEESDVVEEEIEPIRVAIIGRPNVGKSTLLNRLAGSDRSIVSSIPGTTRDPVDARIETGEIPIQVVDTAGIRRHAKIGTAVEHYSVQRAEEALWRSEVALLLVDAAEGATESDARVFSLIEKTGRAAILLVNKWDAVEKETGTLSAFERNVRGVLRFLDFAPILFISALSGQRVNKIPEMIREVRDEWRKRIPTPQLNRFLEDAVTQNPPPSDRGKAVKLRYVTQVRFAPPTFAVFSNRPQAVKPSYQRYLVNRLYEAFGFKGCPIRLHIRGGKSE